MKPAIAFREQLKLVRSDSHRRVYLELIERGNRH